MRNMKPTKNENIFSPPLREVIPPRFLRKTLAIYNSKTNQLDVPVCERVPFAFQDSYDYLTDIKLYPHRPILRWLF